VRFFSATFFCARKNASHFSLSGAKKRHIQPERYVPSGLNFSEIIIKVYWQNKIFLIKLVYVKTEGKYYGR
jgi:hypothetical protein